MGDDGTQSGQREGRQCRAASLPPNLSAAARLPQSWQFTHQSSRARGRRQPAACMAAGFHSSASTGGRPGRSSRAAKPCSTNPSQPLAARQRRGGMGRRGKGRGRGSREALRCLESVRRCRQQRLYAACQHHQYSPPPRQRPLTCHFDGGHALPLWQHPGPGRAPCHELAGLSGHSVHRRRPIPPLHLHIHRHRRRRCFCCSRCGRTADSGGRSCGTRRTHAAAAAVATAAATIASGIGGDGGGSAGGPRQKAGVAFLLRRS